jgi:hypothetical protein
VADNPTPHTADYDRLVGTAHLGADHARTTSIWVEHLMKVRDDELVALSQLRSVARIEVTEEAIAAEIARRSIVALVDFKDAAGTASNRLETLTRWLIVFTCAVVLLTVVLVVHDLTR